MTDGIPTDAFECRRDTLALVNREEEMSSLSALVQDARAGSGGIALVEGVVGIGKSLLLHRLVATLPTEGLQVLEARCDALERDFPFGVVRQLFEPLLATLDEPRLTRLLAGSARTAAQALSGETLPGDVMLPTEDMSYAVLHGLYWFTCNVAAEAPLVIVVDDAHCADMASLRFLTHLARRIEGLPILLVLSQRTGDKATTDAALLGDIAAQPLCRVLRPGPLTCQGIGRMVKTVFGHEADEEFHEACLALTGGNPLLVHSLLSVLRLDGRPPTVDALGYIAQDGTFVHEAVRAILQSQPESASAAARALAVMGDEALPEVCARLAGLDDATHSAAMWALRSNGLVSEVDDGRRWSFNHGLIREVIVADLPPERLAEAHQRAARLLLDAGARAEQVAGHLLMTTLPATEDWAVTVLREAAREASFRGAPALAVDLLRHCLPADGQPPEDTAVLVELGLAEAGVDPQASVRHLQAALEHVHEPSLRFRLLSSLASGLIRSGQSLQAVRLLAEQAPTVRDADLQRLLEGQRLMASAEDLSSFAVTLREYPFDISRPGTTPGERALIAAGAGLCSVRADRAQESAAAARRVLESSVPGVDSPFFLTTAATALLYAGLPDEADAAYGRIIDDTRASQRLLLYGLCQALRAEARYRLGALSESLAATRSALNVVPPRHWGRTLALPVATQIHALIDTGDLAGADAAAAQAFPSTSLDTWQWNEFLCARGRLRLAHQDPKAALADLLEAGRRQHQWTRTSPAVSSWWSWAGRAHLALGALAPARELAEDAVESARKGNLTDALGAGLRLLATTESGPRKLGMLEEALSALAGSPARLELAHTLVDYGAALHACGHTEAARETLRQGLDLAYTLGAARLRARANDALLATGARPRRVTSSGVESLTPSEAQVARMAAVGETNREIAEELFVTQRTVEQHLTSVYRKLAVSGRRGLGSFFDPERTAT
ncbi:AAA family ATPase [Streptomyces sp. NBC_01456]|uniref:ATP-binding protein n=1 Tax=unclassified Streptomyces TaxID=2593676 RepID=UPI002E306CF6|nr:MULTISPECIES: AAA family ATPase [unclassified Streptomyces]